jgi:hypothetical protein
MTWSKRDRLGGLPARVVRPVPLFTGAGPVRDRTGWRSGGQTQFFQRVMHEFHGELEDGGLPVFPSDAAVDDTCYQCHPGGITQCQRGAMKTGGMDCNDCHGDMLAVGGKFPLLDGGSIDGTNDGDTRRPWLDLPRCQSCHTGDAVAHLTGADLVADPDWPFRLRQAYATADASASPLLALNTRFAEDTNALFRFSKGHGGIACQACHGSTHAIWPNAADSANDNDAAELLQGYAGTLIECAACHESGSLPTTTSGPHGLHTVNDSRWYDDGHEDAYEARRETLQGLPWFGSDGNTPGPDADGKAFPGGRRYGGLRQRGPGALRPVPWHAGRRLTAAGNGCAGLMTEGRRLF